MGRNHLLGDDGDRINAILAACGFNLRKLIRAFFWFLFNLIIPRSKLRGIIKLKSLFM
jgi:hypothetical protein